MSSPGSQTSSPGLELQLLFSWVSSFLAADLHHLCFCTSWSKWLIKTYGLIFPSDHFETLDCGRSLHNVCHAPGIVIGKVRRGQVTALEVFADQSLQWDGSRTVRNGNALHSGSILQSLQQPLTLAAALFIKLLLTLPQHNTPPCPGLAQTHSQDVSPTDISSLAHWRSDSCEECSIPKRSGNSGIHRVAAPFHKACC